MIDDIVEMILKEARGRKSGDTITDIRDAMMDANKGVLNVLDRLREEERRKEKDENKG